MNVDYRICIMDDRVSRSSCSNS